MLPQLRLFFGETKACLCRYKRDSSYEWMNLVDKNSPEIELTFCVFYFEYIIT